jgi:hypothetical protein
MDKLAKLLAYVRAAKKSAAVLGHQGTARDDFHMGRAAAYQEMENVLTLTELPQPR